MNQWSAPALAAVPPTATASQDDVVPEMASLVIETTALP